VLYATNVRNDNYRDNRAIRISHYERSSRANFGFGRVVRTPRPKKDTGIGANRFVFFFTIGPSYFWKFPIRLRTGEILFDSNSGRESYRFDNNADR